MTGSRIARDGRVLHYGSPGFDGQCDYEGCRARSWSGRYCQRHGIGR